FTPNESTGIKDEDFPLLGLGHEGEKRGGGAMQPIAVIERDRADGAWVGGSHALDHRQVARTLRGFFPRAVGVLKVLDGAASKLWPSRHRVVLLLQARPARIPVAVKVGATLPGVDEHRRPPGSQACQCGLFSFATPRISVSSHVSSLP